MRSHHATYPPRWAEGTLPENDPASDWALQTIRVALSKCKNTQDADIIDMFETCELLTLDRNTAARTYALALALSMAQALGRPPKVMAAGATELTFDELWLLRLFERSRLRDSESLAFLISSRVAYPFRNSVVFLIEGLIARLYDTNESVEAAPSVGYDPYA